MRFASSFFLTLSYFYYNLSAAGGFDPYFTDLASRYFLERGFDPNATRIYSWPGFFVFVNAFVMIVGVPLRVFQFVFYFVLGIVLSSLVFVICDRPGTQPFVGVWAYGVTGYYFLNYQFAPQTLALAILMAMLLVEFKLPRSNEKNVVLGLLFLGATVTHSFLQLFYLVYIMVRYLWTRDGLARIVSYVAIFAAFNVLFSDFSLSRLVLSLRVSLLEFLGIRQYGGTIEQTLSASTDVIIQQFSRATIVAAGAISFFGVVRNWKRELSDFDRFLTATSLVLVVVGAAIWLVGVRAIQVGVVVAAVGASAFTSKSTPRWHKMLVLALILLSVSIPMHANFDRYLYLSQPTEEAFSFLTGHMIDTTEVARMNVFLPHSLAFSMLLHTKNSENLGLQTEFGSNSAFSDFAFVLTSLQEDHYLAARDASYPHSVAAVMVSGNLIYNNGLARISSHP